MEFTITKKQNNASGCFVCGVNNHSGLHFDFFETAQGPLLGIGTVRSHHQSYPGRVHGGVICALLDEVIGRAIQVGEPDTWAVTVDLDVKFKRPVPYDEQIYLIGSITRNGRVFEGEGKLVLKDGTLACVGVGKYMKLPIEKIGGPLEENGDFWRCFPKEDDPETVHIEIKKR